MASDAPDCRGLAAAFDRAGHALANRANVYACILQVHRGGSVVVCGVAADENTQDPGAPVAASSLPFFESDSGSRLRESPSPAGCNYRASVPAEDTLGISNPGNAMPQRAAHVAHSVVLSTQGAGGLVSSSPSPDAATSTQGAGASVSPPPPPDAATCTGQGSKKKTRDADSDLRAALRERLLQRAMLTREQTLYEYFCDGRFFPCLLVEGENTTSTPKNDVRVYMGNKDYVVHFKPCERAQLVRSAYSCAVTRINESLREVARRSSSTQGDMVRLNKHIVGITSSARFEAGVILRTKRS